MGVVAGCGQECVVWVFCQRALLLHRSALAAGPWLRHDGQAGCHQLRTAVTPVTTSLPPTTPHKHAHRLMACKHDEACRQLEQSPHSPTHPPNPSEQAHYDDLKEEHDEACRQLEQCRSELERARSEARSSAQQVGWLRLLRLGSRHLVWFGQGGDGGWWLRCCVLSAACLPASLPRR